MTLVEKRRAFIGAVAAAAPPYMAAPVSPSHCSLTVRPLEPTSGVLVLGSGSPVASPSPALDRSSTSSMSSPSGVSNLDAAPSLLSPSEPPAQSRRAASVGCRLASGCSCSELAEPSHLALSSAAVPPGSRGIGWAPRRATGQPRTPALIASSVSARGIAGGPAAVPPPVGRSKTGKLSRDTSASGWSPPPSISRRAASVKCSTAASDCVKE